MPTQQSMNAELDAYKQASAEFEQAPIPKGSFEESRTVARKAGSKFFVWNGKWYTVDGSETPRPVNEKE